MRLAAGILMLACALAAAATAAPQTVLPSVQPKEREAITQVCAKCHNLQLVVNTPRSAAQWQTTIQSMVDRGAKGTDEQFDAVMQFLLHSVTTININAADADELSAVLGISDAAAAAIVQRRTQKKFSDLKDLAQVSGIAPASLESRSRLIYF